MVKTALDNFTQSEIAIKPKIFRNFCTYIRQKQNTACLEQQIYPSPENCTHPLVVMVVTFIMSGLQGSTLQRDRVEGSTVLSNSV